MGHIPIWEDISVISWINKDNRKVCDQTVQFEFDESPLAGNSLTIRIIDDDPEENRYVKCVILNGHDTYRLLKFLLIECEGYLYE